MADFSANGACGNHHLGRKWASSVGTSTCLSATKVKSRTQGKVNANLKKRAIENVRQKIIFIFPNIITFIVVFGKFIFSKVRKKKKNMFFLTRLVYVNMYLPI